MRNRKEGGFPKKQTWTGDSGAPATAKSSEDDPTDVTADHVLLGGFRHLGFRVRRQRCDNS